MMGKSCKTFIAVKPQIANPILYSLCFTFPNFTFTEAEGYSALLLSKCQQNTKYFMNMFI